MCVGVALGTANLLYDVHIRGVEFPTLLFGVAVVVWYAGIGPGILALVLTIAGFNYYFTTPRYSFHITPADIPHSLLFVIFALLIIWFSSVRRRVEINLLQSGDKLRQEMAIRTQQASLLNLTHDPIFVRDMNGVITYWNRGAEELYGWTAEQAIGRRTHNLLRTIFPKPFEEIQTELFQTGRWEGELKKVKADGTSVFLASRWSLQRDEHENPIAILETENDITERKQQDEHVRELNQELSRRSGELESMNKELEAFAYSVSHDLRAPLRHMIGYRELLQKSASSQLDDKARRYTTMILESAKRMGTLIDDLLAFSRIGRAETRETMVSLGQIVMEAQSEVWREALPNPLPP